MSDDSRTKGLENQVKGAAKEMSGKVRNAAGGLTGNTSEQIKGKGKEMEGKFQRKVGEAQSDVESHRKS